MTIGDFLKSVNWKDVITGTLKLGGAIGLLQTAVTLNKASDELKKESEESK